MKNVFKFLVISGVLVGLLYAIAGTLGVMSSKAPKYSPEQCVLIVQTDSIDNEIAYFVFDVVTRKISDVAPDEDLSSINTMICVDSCDYQRLHAGKVTDEEVDQFKFDIEWTLNESEIEWCQTREDKDGNVIEHYHTQGAQVVQPSEECESAKKFFEYQQSLAEK